MPDAQALDGTVVLDLSDEPLIIAGRYLADLGARVVRVESANGDRIRRVGPWVDGEAGNERALRHLLYNQGKESLALDLDAAGVVGNRRAIGFASRCRDRAIGEVEPRRPAHRASARLRAQRRGTVCH